jgi:hypothetical protein
MIPCENLGGILSDSAVPNTSAFASSLPIDPIFNPTFSQQIVFFFSSLNRVVLSADSIARFYPGAAIAISKPAGLSPKIWSH